MSDPTISAHSEMSTPEASTSGAKTATAPAAEAAATTEPTATPSPAEKKRNPIFRFFWQSYKTPEEKVADEAKAAEEAKQEGAEQENSDSVRKWFHENVAQSIHSETPPHKPPPTPEEKEAAQKKKEEERANRKPFMQRVKESFRSGKSKTCKEKTLEEKDKEEEVTPAQGPGMQTSS